MNVQSEHFNPALAVVGGLALLLSPWAASAFDSGSTGADGAFRPTVSQEVALPANGVLNFSDVDIPLGVVITFRRNPTNTPVTLLASGDVTIAGEINVSGSGSPPSGSSGDGNLGDDGLPGLGGPGGFDGGRGSPPPTATGGEGLGPGGGKTSTGAGFGGGGGAFGTAGGTGQFAGPGGSAYGSQILLPLIGGSGGAGAGSGVNFGGSGGAGGGGAILIAASGTVTLSNGIIRANGGRPGASGGLGVGGTGGAGSGGGIRIVATTIAGSGTIEAQPGINTAAGNGGSGGVGGAGRIRLESEIFTFSSTSNPAFSFAAPGEVFVAGIPSLRITSVAGVPAPAQPTGDADITLATTEPNPVTVNFATTSVPTGNTVTLRVIPPSGPSTVAISDALAGSLASATASVAVDIPDGPSVLSATLSFTVTASLGDALRQFAEGERVARVMLAAAPGGGSVTTLVTASGKHYSYPAGG